MTSRRAPRSPTAPLVSRSRSAAWVARARSEILSNLFDVVASWPARSSAATASRWRSRWCCARRTRNLAVSTRSFGFLWTIPKLSDSGSRLCGESHIDQGRSGLPAYPAIFVEGETHAGIFGSVGSDPSSPDDWANDVGTAEAGPVTENAGGR